MKIKFFNTNKNLLYCGPPGLEIKSFFTAIDSDNIISWFDNRKVVYFHKARVAIRYACDLLGIGAGDTILAPSYNCGSEIDPLYKSGAEVSLYRVDETGQIDISDLQKRVNAKTRLIYVTHYFGFPHDLTQIKKICKVNDIFLLEDCALSLLSNEPDRKKIGSTGDISVFCFPKTLPVPDGGVMVINNPLLNSNQHVLLDTPPIMIIHELYLLLKRLLLHKLSCCRPLFSFIFHITRKSRPEDKYSANNKFPDIPTYEYYQINLNRRKISGLTKYMLKHWNSNHIMQIRRSNYQRYLRAFADHRNIKLLFNELPEGVCPLYFPILVNKSKYINWQLNLRSVGSIAWWSLYHRNCSWQDYPEACYLKNNLLVLPVHHQLNEKHIDYIIRQVNEVLVN
jgi:dTDP-4-amino-4,6-dideoxygalactose transaminase